MTEWVTFPYLPVAGATGLMPLVPVTLGHENHRINAQGLIDSGATVNVLPYSLGLQLGLDWESETRVIHLTGMLGRLEARAMLVDATVGGFASTRLAFAWSRSDDVRLILGQTNFFLTFDVQFRRADLAFDLRSRQG